MSYTILTLKMANISTISLLLRRLSNETCFWKFSHFHLHMLFLEKLLIILLGKQTNIKQNKCSIMYKALWQCISVQSCFSHCKCLRFKFQHICLFTLENALLSVSYLDMNIKLKFIVTIRLIKQFHLKVVFNLVICWKQGLEIYHFYI